MWAYQGSVKFSNIFRCEENDIRIFSIILNLANVNSNLKIIKNNNKTVSNFVKVFVCSFGFRFVSMDLLNYPQNIKHKTQF